MASIAQLHANRENAKRSTGPRSEQGRAASGTNAIRTGLRSARLIVDGEDPEEFAALCADLDSALRPVGAVEAALAERIALALWRQRRLVTAETSAINLERRPSQIARGAEMVHEPGFFRAISRVTEPFDEEQTTWCQGVLDEMHQLEEIRLDTLAKKAPLIYAQLKCDADENHEDLAQHVAGLEHGVTSYVGDLAQRCCEQLNEAEQRPRLIALAEQLRAKRLVLPMEQLETLSRYQTTLDNQLYRALRALREAQEWRLKTLEGETVDQFAETDIGA